VGEAPTHRGGHQGAVHPGRVDDLAGHRKEDDLAGHRKEAVAQHVDAERQVERGIEERQAGARWRRLAQEVHLKESQPAPGSAAACTGPAPQPAPESRQDLGKPLKPSGAAAAAPGQRRSLHRKAAKTSGAAETSGAAAACTGPAPQPAPESRQDLGSRRSLGKPPEAAGSRRARPTLTSGGPPP